MVNTHPKEITQSHESHSYEVRDQFLKKCIDKVVDAYEHDNLQALSFYFENDETGHPNINGTKTLLELINETAGIEPRLIWDSKWILSGNIYRNVDNIYRYGCNHCEKYGREISHRKYKNGTVCDECMGLLKCNSIGYTSPLLQAVIDEVFKESSPKRGAMPVIMTKMLQHRLTSR